MDDDTRENPGAANDDERPERPGAHPYDLPEPRGRRAGRDPRERWDSRDHRDPRERWEERASQGRMARQDRLGQPEQPARGDRHRSTPEMADPGETPTTSPHDPPNHTDTRESAPTPRGRTPRFDRNPGADRHGRLGPRRRAERKAPRRDNGVLVIGLGRFGSAIASTLERLGQDVLAVERDPELVAQWAGRVPLIEADAVNPDALEQLGAQDFAVAVVGVGSYLEASVLITGNLVDIGIPQIWTKAVSAEHARILQRIGAHHVVLPEADAGFRVAHLVSGKLLDYIEVEDGFTIVKMRPPRETQGFTIAQSRIQERYGVTVIGVKSPGVDFAYATAHTRISANDLLIVSGNTELLERFAARP